MSIIKVIIQNFQRTRYRLMVKYQTNKQIIDKGKKDNNIIISDSTVIAIAALIFGLMSAYFWGQVFPDKHGKHRPVVVWDKQSYYDLLEYEAKKFRRKERRLKKEKKIIKMQQKMEEEQQAEEYAKRVAQERLQKNIKEIEQEQKKTAKKKIIDEVKNGVEREYVAYDIPLNKYGTKFPNQGHPIIIHGKMFNEEELEKMMMGSEYTQDVINKNILGSQAWIIDMGKELMLNEFLNSDSSNWNTAVTSLMLYYKTEGFEEDFIIYIFNNYVHSGFKG